MADSNLKFIQINLQHCKESTAVLCSQLCSMHTCIALIQEPYIYKSKIRGLSVPGAQLLYKVEAMRPRAAILATKAVKAVLVPQLTPCTITLTL